LVLPGHLTGTNLFNGGLDLAGSPAEIGQAGNAGLDEGRVIRVAQQVNHQLLGGILDRIQEFFIGGIEMAS